MENKTLIRIVKAVASHVSKDKFRPHLGFIAVTSDRRLEATDGHRAIRVDTDPPHGLPVGFYEPKKLLALLKTGAMPEAGSLPNGYTWPSFDPIIPAREEAPAAVPYVNPSYVAESASALAEILNNKRPAIRLQPGADALSPMRLDAHGEYASAVAVIMPVRA
jgi:hypothetical protein